MSMFPDTERIERTTQRLHSGDLKERILVLSLLIIISYFAVNLAATLVGGTKNLLVGDAVSYLDMYKALRDGTFTRGSFTYGIGFPLMGFLSPYQDNPFILFSLLLAIFAFYQLYLILREFFSLNPALLSLFIVLATAPVFIYYIRSQNCIITTTIIIYLCSLLIRGKTLTLHSSLILGFLFGLDFASRYIDPILLLPGIFYIFIRTLTKNRKWAFSYLLIFSFVFAIWVVVTLSFHKIYLGDYLKTPYSSHYPYVDRVGLRSEDIFTHMRFHYFNDIVRNFFQVFIDPYAYALPQDIAGRKSLFKHMPYLLFVFAGIYYWIKNKKPKIGTLISLSLILIATIVFYCSFWAFTAHDLKYDCLRYLSGWYPIMGAFSLYGIKSIYHNVRNEKQMKHMVKYLLLIIIVHLVLFGSIKSIPSIDNWYTDHLSYPRRNWSVITSKNQEDAYKMIDNDTVTRWCTATTMKKGDYIIIDTNELVELSQIRFDLQDKAESDFPRELDVYYSLGEDKYERIEDIKSRRQNHIWSLNFPTIKARSIRVEVLQGCSDEKDNYWWSIYELNLLR